MILGGPNVCRRGRARTPGALAALAGLIVLVAAPARAGYAPLDSPEVRTWLQNTAAHALEAADPADDLHVGGIAALNRTLRSGLAALDQVAPPRLQRVDVGLRFDRDLRAAYRLATVQPVVRVGGGHHLIDLEARLDYDQAGTTSSRIGIGYRGVGTDDTVAARLRGGFERDPVHERYVLEAELDWLEAGRDGAPLSLSGRLFNDVPLGEAAAAAVRHDPVLDGYDLDAGFRLPFASWFRARAGLFWRENNGAAVTGDRLSLVFRPVPSLRVETGTRAGSGPVRDWFARLRVKLAFGGPA